MIGYGHVCLSLVGPKLEAETKFRRAVSYGSNPGCLRPIVKGVIICLPGLSARNQGLTSHMSSHSTLSTWETSPSGT